MAEHKYVSLKDVPKDQSTTKIKLKEPNDGSEDEPDSNLVSKNLRNPNLPSSPPSSLVGSCSNIQDEGKAKKDDEKKKKSFRGRFSSMRHSRSDDPLVYVKCDGDDAFDNLKTLSQEMKSFTWEE